MRNQLNKRIFDMNELIQKLCSKGDEAHKLFSSGFYKNAEKKFYEILKEIEHEKKVDSYVVSKAVLGLLLSSIKLQNFEKALEIWNNHAEDSVYAIGIYGLENAQTAVHDMFVYDFVCAYLHSLSHNTPKNSAQAINLYMSRICQHATQAKDQKLMRLAISNWKQHLREVFPHSIPHELAAPLIKFEKKFGEVVALMALDFPKLANWVKPDDFREMSRLINLDAAQLNAMGLGQLPTQKRITPTTHKKTVRK
jgi:hypothetical protein